MLDWKQFYIVQLQLNAFCESTTQIRHKQTCLEECQFAAYFQPTWDVAIFPKETQHSPKPILKSEMTKPEITNKVGEKVFSSRTADRIKNKFSLTGACSLGFTIAFAMELWYQDQPQQTVQQSCERICNLTNMRISPFLCYTQRVCSELPQLLLHSKAPSSIPGFFR